MRIFLAVILVNLDVYGIVFSPDFVLLFRQIADIYVSRSKIGLID